MEGNEEEAKTSWTVTRSSFLECTRDAGLSVPLSFKSRSLRCDGHILKSSDSVRLHSARLECWGKVAFGAACRAQQTERGPGAAPSSPFPQLFETPPVFTPAEQKRNRQSREGETAYYASPSKDCRRSSSPAVRTREPQLQPRLDALPAQPLLFIVEVDPSHAVSLVRRGIGGGAG